MRGERVSILRCRNQKEAETKFFLRKGRVLRTEHKCRKLRAGFEAPEPPEEEKEQRGE